MDISDIRNLLGNEFAFIFKEINLILIYLDLAKTAKILDIGTGVGWMAITLALNNYEVITGEPEEDESEYAKRDWLENAMKLKVDHMIKYVPFNAEDMPFEDATFNAVFIMGTLHHINDRITALKESFRVLKKNGLICIMEPNDELMRIIRGNKYSTHPDPVDPREYTLKLQLSLEIIKGDYYDTYVFRKQ